MTITNPAPQKAVLAIGGLDPTGAAGILLDMAAIRSVGIHGAAVNAVSTVQDGLDFLSSSSEDAKQVRAAAEKVLENLRVCAVKTGALGNRDIVAAVARLAAKPESPPLVVDPVIKSSTGGVLLDDSGVAALRDQLLPHTSLVTPNLSEASILTGLDISGLSDMKVAARRLIELGAKAVLIKGGHLEGAVLKDLFLDCSGIEHVFVGERIGTDDVRGTGCALASLVAAYLCREENTVSAVEKARIALRNAIAHAAPIKRGPPVLSFLDGPARNSRRSPV